MGMQALNHGIMTLKHPVMWIYPILAGLFFFAAVMFSLAEVTDYFGLKFVLLFFVFVSPFFVAGTYAAVKSGDFSIKSYFKSAAEGYFRIMLPKTALYFVIVLIMFITTIPASFMQNAAFFSVFAFFIAVTMIMLTFFYDTAAIFENKKIFESLTRSIGLVSAKPLEAILFFIVAALLAFVFFMGYTMVWSSLLAEEFEPLLTMTQSELTAFSQDTANLVNLIGDRGVLVTAVISGITMLLFTLIFLPYKAVFYRDDLMVSFFDIPENRGDKYVYFHTGADKSSSDENVGDESDKKESDNTENK
ncbi:MAG: hypothetical protein J5703_07670 [Methanomicrobium sp.]|nr:hypothetical protein [Methanomicrobium sp.]